MRFDFDLTIPANTAASSPASLAVMLTSGRLTMCQIYFKAGCNNYVYAALYDGLFQLAPAHGCQPAFGDDKVQEMPLDYKLDSAGHELILRGWSPLTRYPHTVTFYLYLETGENEINKQYADFIKSLEVVP